MKNAYRWAAAAALVSCGWLATGVASADAIPYPNAGTPIATPSYNFTATATGDITAYFFASDAGDEEEVSMIVNGVPTGIFGLNNHTSTVGEAFNLGAVTAGDTIEFYIHDITTSV